MFDWDIVHPAVLVSLDNPHNNANMAKVTVLGGGGRRLFLELFL